jgi:hypothetical protein
MLQFQKALRTIVGPPDAAWRLGDALKTEFLALGAELKKPRRAFSAPTNYSPKKTADERSASRANGNTKTFRVFDGFRITLSYTLG